MSLLNRDTALERLHPYVRDAVVSILADLKADPDCCEFQIWEAYRTPERQHHLFTTKTRMRSGKLRRRTKARPWQSMHQYGVAVDLVIDHPDVGKWSARDDGQRSWWRKMHAAAERHGMRPLRTEKPHIQLATDRSGAPIRWQRMKAGEWPSHGSDLWSENIHAAIDRFPKRAPVHGPPVGDEGNPDACRPQEADGLWA